MELVCCLFFLIASSQPSLYTASPGEAFRLPLLGIQMLAGFDLGDAGYRPGTGMGVGAAPEVPPTPLAR